MLENPTLIDRYTYRLAWSKDDQEFVATCDEFPSLSWLNKNRVKALAGILRLVKSVLEDMRKTAEVPPVPLIDR